MIIGFFKTAGGMRVVCMCAVEQFVEILQHLVPQDLLISNMVGPGQGASTDLIVNLVICSIMTNRGHFLVKMGSRVSPWITQIGDLMDGD